MIEVRNNGVPLIEQAPKAAITQSIVGLADALCGDPKDAETDAARQELDPRPPLQDRRPQRAVGRSA